MIISEIIQAIHNFIQYVRCKQSNLHLQGTDDSMEIDGINMMPLKDLINRSRRTDGSATAAAMM